jgi:predicted MFS family arabinose efflux permease
MKKSIYPWVVVALLWVVAALNYIDRQVIFSLFPLLRADLHVTNTQLGLLGTAFLWVYGIASPFGGYVADRFNRRSVILLSFAIWSAVTFMVGHAHSYSQLLTAQALLGVSEAFYLPAGLALIADYHSAATRSRAIGLHQSGLYTGVALGGFGGSWIGQHYGWHNVFYVLGGCGVLYSIVLFVGLRNPPKRQKIKEQGAGVLPFTKAMRELAGNNSFLLLVLANCFAAIAFWCIYTWLATFLYERYHVSLTAAGFSSTFYIQAASFVGILGGGWLADGWSRTNRHARAWTQAIGLMLAGPALFLAASTGSWKILLPCLVCFGLGRGFFDCNLMPVLCQVVSEKLRATAYGIFNFTSCICGGLMALAAGILKDRVGLGVALEISAAFLVAGPLCVAVLKVNGARASEVNA